MPTCSARHKTGIVISASPTSESLPHTGKQNRDLPTHVFETSLQQQTASSTWYGNGLLQRCGANQKQKQLLSTGLALRPEVNTSWTTGLWETVLLLPRPSASCSPPGRDRWSAVHDLKARRFHVLSVRCGGTGMNVAVVRSNVRSDTQLLQQHTRGA